MSDDFKQKLLTAIVSAVVSAGLSFAGFEKSSHDSDSKTDGRSWIAKDLQNHTERENQLQQQLNNLQQELLSLKQQPQMIVPGTHTPLPMPYYQMTNYFLGISNQSTLIGL